MNEPLSTEFLSSDHYQTLIQSALAYAKQQGATSAAMALSLDHGFTTTVRMRSVESLEHQRDKTLGVTVYFGQKKGSASTNDLREFSLQEAIRAACDIARYTTEDSYAGLPDASQQAKIIPNCDLYHPWDLTPAQAIEKAQACEEIALSSDSRLVNSEGVTISSHNGQVVYANTNDFIGQFPYSRHEISCVLVGKDKAGLQRDYAYTVARSSAGLKDIKQVAAEAVERTCRRLNPQVLKNCRVPVIFSAEIAKGLLGHFLGAIRGSQIYRQASFLMDCIGHKIFPEFVQIAEHPHLRQGLGSSPFDQEGVATRQQSFILDGVLQQYLLSSYSARKLGLQTTGNAGGAHNVIIESTMGDLQSLIAHMDKGVVVTELMGQGVNIMTGDYSRGAAGFWVEGGKIQYPVDGFTIAGNLKDMYSHIVGVGSDVDKRGNIQTGSILIEGLTIAG